VKKGKTCVLPLGSGWPWSIWSCRRDFARVGGGDNKDSWEEKKGEQRAKGLRMHRYSKFESLLGTETRRQAKSKFKEQKGVEGSF